MKILVTGSTGFLGRFLVEKLKKNDHDIIALNSKIADLRENNSLNFLINEKFDFIYHLAAWTQAGDFCLYHKGEQWINNQLINANILNYWVQNNPSSKFVSIGTSCSYDPSKELIESNYLIGQPINSLYTYAMTKRMLQVGLESFSHQYGMKYLTVVPSTLYGPNYHDDGRQMHFIFDLIYKILRGKKYNIIPVLWGDGNQRRELVFVDDFVNKLDFLSANVTNEIVNIGAGVDYSIKDFSKEICNIVDYDYELIKFDTSKYVGAKTKKLSIKKLNSYISNSNVTSLSTGLKKTIQWMENNIEIQRKD